MCLLVFNAGSSSLKFSVFDVSTGQARESARGSVAPLSEHAVLTLVHGGGQVRRNQPVNGMQAAVRECLDLLEQTVLKQAPVSHLAHRMVYGPIDVGEVARIDSALLEQLRAVAPLAPLHQQLEMDVMRSATEILGSSLPTFAAFDSGFFHSLPAHASCYAIPQEVSTSLGIRRRGFHGFAHRSMLKAYCEAAGTSAGTGRVITFQLGGGCSAAAIRNGEPVDTSMGFTPLEGLVMATRCGDLDPGVVFECVRRGMSIEQVHDMLERQSGLRGLSGVSADVGELLVLAAQGHERANLAIDIYCSRARKYLGAFLTDLGGADAIVFGGGVGQHESDIRARICSGMEWCGLHIDSAANKRFATGTQKVSSENSAIAIYVAIVDEEAIIANAVLHAIAAESRPAST